MARKQCPAWVRILEAGWRHYLSAVYACRMARLAKERPRPTPPRKLQRRTVRH